MSQIFTAQAAQPLQFIQQPLVYPEAYQFSYTAKMPTMASVVQGSMKSTQQPGVAPIDDFPLQARFPITVQNSTTLMPNDSSNQSSSQPLQTALQKCISDLKCVYEERQGIFVMKNTLKNKVQESKKNTAFQPIEVESSFTELETELDKCLARTNKTLMEAIKRLQSHMRSIQGVPTTTRGVHQAPSQVQSSNSLTQTPTLNQSDHVSDYPQTSHVDVALHAYRPEGASRASQNRLQGSLLPATVGRATESIPQSIGESSDQFPHGAVPSDESSEPNLAQNSQFLKSTSKDSLPNHKFGVIPTPKQDAESSNLSYDQEPQLEMTESCGSRDSDQKQKIKVSVITSPVISKKRRQRRDFGPESADNMGFTKHYVLSKNTGRANQVFKCTQCPIRTPKLCNMLVHQKTHRQEKSYQCPHCRSSFIQAVNRDRHYQSGVCLLKNSPKNSSAFIQK